MFGASFPFKIQEKGLHRGFREGGVFWGPKILYAEFLCALFLHLNGCDAPPAKLPRNGLT